MEISCRVCLDLGVERSWSPRCSEEWNRNNLTEAVDLETAASHGAHDGGVMDHVHFDTVRHASKVEVGVSGRTERVSHDKE